MCFVDIFLSFFWGHFRSAIFHANLKNKDVGEYVSMSDYVKLSDLQQWRKNLNIYYKAGILESG